MLFLIIRKFTSYNECIEKLRELEQNLDCLLVGRTNLTQNTIKDINNFDTKVTETFFQFKEGIMSTNCNELLLSSEITNLQNNKSYTYNYHKHYTLLLENFIKSIPLENIQLTKNLNQVYRQVLFITHQLGLWCGGRLAEIFMNGKEQRNFKSNTNEFPTPKYEQVTKSDITIKLMSLIEIILTRTLNTDEFRCMIFVNTRISARILNDFFNIAGVHMFDNKVKSGFVTGHGIDFISKTNHTTEFQQQQNQTNTKNMNSKFQKKIFEDFRAGLINNLFVTRVAEEGIDM